MRYYGALKTKGMQSCKPSKFPKTGNGKILTFNFNDPILLLHKWPKKQVYLKGTDSFHITNLPKSMDLI